MKRYHWTVLPQGMKNSPTMCQIYVAWALQPIRLRWPQLTIYHYMDDILIPGKDMDKETIKRDLISSMEKKGLQIAPEKVQETEPWKYLGWEITKTQINPQNLKIRTEIRTLNDVQKLVGDLNWIRTICGISNEDLAPLIELLRGPGDINAPRQLTMRAREALQAIMRRVTTLHADRRVYLEPIILAIINQQEQPYGVIMQWITEEKEPLKILEWIFLPSQPRKTISTRLESIGNVIIKGRARIVEISGQEPGTILIPLQMDYLNWAIQNSLTIQLALQGFPGDIKVHYPPHKLFTFLYEWGLEEKPKCSEKPVLGCMVFTDGGGRSGKGAVVWKENGTWKRIMIKKEGSVQKIELQAVVEAFKRWATKPLNVVSDSLYVVGVVRHMERATLRHVNQEDLYQQFKTLWHLLEQCTEPYYITHI